MVLEYGGRPDGTRRSKMRIPGGPGARRQSMRAEDYPDMSSAREYSGSDRLEDSSEQGRPEDLAVLKEMHNADVKVDSNMEDTPPVGGTQYDRLVQEAQDPTSTAFWNGKQPPVLTEREKDALTETGEEPPLTEGEQIQDRIERPDFSRSPRGDLNRAREFNWSRFWKSWVSRNDNKTKKRGGRVK